MVFSLHCEFSITRSLAQLMLNLIVYHLRMTIKNLAVTTALTRSPPPWTKESTGFTAVSIDSQRYKHNTRVQAADSTPVAPGPSSSAHKENMMVFSQGRSREDRNLMAATARNYNWDLQSPVRIGTWNITTVWHTGFQVVLACELLHLDIAIAGLTECQITCSERHEVENSTFRISGGSSHHNAVALVLCRVSQRCLKS